MQRTMSDDDSPEYRASYAAGRGSVTRTGEHCASERNVLPLVAVGRWLPRRSCSSRIV